MVDVSRCLQSHKIFRESKNCCHSFQSELEFATSFAAAVKNGNHSKDDDDGDDDDDVDANLKTERLMCRRRRHSCCRRSRFRRCGARTQQCWTMFFGRQKLGEGERGCVCVCVCVCVRVCVVVVVCVVICACERVRESQWV